jgi:hypothetical protein
MATTFIKTVLIIYFHFHKISSPRYAYIRALSAASAAKFNIAPVRWQHPSLLAIVPPESKRKTEGNDWDTACGKL